MSDKDKHQDNDIVASAEDAPETIGDEQLEDIDGGGWKLRNVQVTSYSFGGSSAANRPDMETIYAGSADDVIDMGALRPTKRGMPDPYGF